MRAAGTSIPLADLVNLNDEIVALVEAGVPLELGLSALGRERSGALGRIASAVASRMEQGRSFPEALEEAVPRLPKTYKAVVVAGLRTGRLASGLESTSAFATHMLDVRRRITQAMIYPLIVCGLAYGLFVVFILACIGQYESIRRSLEIGPNRTVEALLAVRDYAAFWVWIPPVAFVLMCAWWIKTGGAEFLRFREISRPLLWLPGLCSIAANLRSARFAGMLALLVENDVPLDEALGLAAETTGDPAVETAARSLGVALAQGEDVGSATGLNERRETRGVLPPFLKWIVLEGRGEASFARSLDLAAEMYRRRAMRQTEWLQFGFPIVAGVVIGGGATLVYALTLALPAVEMLEDLAV